VEGHEIIAYRPKVIADPAINIDKAREAAASLHITQGVLATRLEWALMAQGGAGLGASVLNTTRPQHQKSVRAREGTGGAHIVLRPGSAGVKQLAGLSVPGPIEEELSESLGTGHTLVLPAKAPKVGDTPQLAWWQLDDASEETMGIMPAGRGQGEVEYNGVVVAFGAESLC
jgi:hypothetical protein